MKSQTCPKCQNPDTDRIGTSVTNPQTGRRTVAAYWNVCKGCWYKWDGVTDGLGIMPAGVESRLTAQEQYLVSRGWEKPSWSNRQPEMWVDPVLGRESVIAQAVTVQRERDALEEVGQ